MSSVNNQAQPLPNASSYSPIKDATAVLKQQDISKLNEIEKTILNKISVIKVLLSHKDQIMMVEKDGTIIGRYSPLNLTDTYVSREHFRLYLDENRRYLALECLSQNGIYVEQQFVHKDEEIILPLTCTFRFSSTNIIIKFRNLTIEKLQLEWKPFKFDHGMFSLFLSYPFMAQEVLVTKAQKEANQVDKENSRPGRKPKVTPYYSYSQMSAQAITSSSAKKLDLKDIFSYIEQHYQSFTKRSKKWKKSVEYSLNNDPSFIKITIENSNNNECMWELNPEYEKEIKTKMFKTNSGAFLVSPKVED